MAKKKRRTIKKIKRRRANPPKFYRAKLGRAKRKLFRPEKRRPAKAVRKKTSRRPTKKTVKTRPTPRYVLDNSFEFL